jgi:hypothetical protein
MPDAARPATDSPNPSGRALLTAVGTVVCLVLAEIGRLEHANLAVWTYMVMAQYPFRVAARERTDRGKRGGEASGSSDRSEVSPDALMSGHRLPDFRPKFAGTRTSAKFAMLKET